MHQIAPSILNADFMNMEQVILMLNRSEADLIHLDIMDGAFVPNLTFGFPIIKQIKAIAQKPLDTHLMIAEPERYIQAFRDAGADLLTVHFEAVKDLSATLKEIKSLGMEAAVSVKPETDVEVLRPFVDQLDMILIMSVEPGYGGQSFMEAAFDRVRKVKEMIREAGSHTRIEIDGGIGRTNLVPLREAGVDIFVIGTAIFKADDPLAEIASFKNL